MTINLFPITFIYNVYVFKRFINHFFYYIWILNHNLKDLPYRKKRSSDTFLVWLHYLQLDP